MLKEHQYQDLSLLNALICKDLFFKSARTAGLRFSLQGIGVPGEIWNV
jgi:hypothetical protein